MNTNDESKSGIKLLDAVEALSTIVDTSWERESEELYELESSNWKDAGWLTHGDKKDAISNVKEIFKVILKYLKTSDAHELKDIEELKTIMLIVGEAAKKIDRYTDLFHTKQLDSVTEIREYKQLQEFYNKKISKSIDEAILSKWIFALSQKAFQEQSQNSLDEKLIDTKHVFVDLDSVKNDTEYELFFIKKADGTRFFSPRLIKNITLICDFGFRLGQEKDRDPLIDLSLWSDRYGFGVADSILKNAKAMINQYYPIVIHHKHLAFCSSTHKAILALYSAASQDHLLSSGSTKGCLSYLADFQMYFREALESRSFQNMVAFPNQEYSTEEVASKKIIDELLKHIFESKIKNERLDSYLHFLVTESNDILSAEHKKAINLDNPIWSRLACDYAAMQKFLRTHPNGTLNKVLHLIESGNYNSFDPWMQQRLPEILFDIDYSSIQTSIHQIASPTIQKVINEAELTSEWLSYLRSKQDEKLVVFNFQDNTSWREHARSAAVENLQDATEFEKNLRVITLPKDTEFYHQEMPYAGDNRVEDFKKHFIEHLQGEHTGFYFPASLSQHLTKEWMEDVMNSINRTFFFGKNVLTKEARMNFIEIFYAFIQLKIIDVLHPARVYLTCKDGVDSSPASGAVFYVFMNLLQGKDFGLEEIEILTDMIYRPSLLSRERVMLANRADRLFGAIKVIEMASRDDGFKAKINKEFGTYYSLEL